MKNLSIKLLFFFFSICISLQAQTYDIGVMNFSFNDPARGGRVVDGEIHYPANTAGNGVAIATGQFPLIIFGHGFSVDIDQYDGVYSEGLVREGYIIVYPTTEGGGIFNAPDHEEFAQDLSFLVDTYLAENTNPASFFFQTMNSKTSIMGHSMGGGASFKAVSINPNVTAHASFAAAETFAPASAIDASSSITVPSLVYSASKDCVVPIEDIDMMYNNLNSSYKAYISITDGSHCDFGEAASGSNCVLGEGFSCPFETFIPIADQHTYTLASLKPWLDYWLKDDCEAWDTYQNYLTTATTHTYMQEGEQLIPPCCPDVLTLNSNVITNTYNAEIQIICDDAIVSPENVIFEAGNCINLNEGFEVQLGAEFLAIIDTVDPCN